MADHVANRSWRSIRSRASLGVHLSTGALGSLSCWRLRCLPSLVGLTVRSLTPDSLYPEALSRPSPYSTLEVIHVEQFVLTLEAPEFGASTIESLTGRSI